MVSELFAGSLNVCLVGKVEDVNPEISNVRECGVLVSKVVIVEQLYRDRKTIIDPFQIRMRKLQIIIL